MEIANIYENLTYHPDKPMMTVLLNTDFTKEIRIAMQAGTIMKKHKTKFPIVVELVEGSIDFGVEEATHALHKGDIITLESNIPHDLKAKENSIVRLTLNKSDTANRVQDLTH